MRKVRAGVAAAAATLVVMFAPPAQAQKRETIELQRDVKLLQEQVRELRQTVDRDNAVLKQLVEQAVDAVNRMNATVKRVEESVREAQATTNTRVDTLATQVQSLRDATDELTARLGLVAQQLAETQQVLESVDARLAGAPGPPQVAEVPGAPGATPTPGAAATPTAAPPSAQSLYDNALRDFLSGKHELARQEFTDYLKYYGRTPRAGNAQFYIGETYYREGDFRRAIVEYDKVIEQYPTSNKVAGAYLKKGYALLELNEREAGVAALRAVVEKFPRGDEAKWARARLERLGERVTP